MSVKQVIVIRKDLKMRRGKEAAQAAHASMKVFFDLNTSTDKKQLNISLTEEMSEWVYGNFTKIVVGCDDENELISCYKKAQEAGIVASIIEDAGLTEFNGVKTITCIAIGPGDSGIIDRITSHLQLR